jgi:hypothetical protein
MDRDEWSGMTSLDRIIGKSSEWRRVGFGEISEAWTGRSDCSSCTTVPVPLRIVECRDSLGSLGTCHRHRPRRYLCLTIGWGSPPPHHPKRNARTLLTSIESAPDIFYEERRESEPGRNSSLHRAQRNHHQHRYHYRTSAKQLRGHRSSVPSLFCPVPD